MITKNNYVCFHLHSDLSLLDSTTKFQNYIDKAKELEQQAICFTEHGVIYNWVSKKIACDKAGIKYLHGCEVYLTEELEPKKRDNYHTILIAKNQDGLLELNSLISLSNTKDHFYFKPRITFDEFYGISNNIIKISACLASPLNKLVGDKEKLLQKYDYYEVQPHINSDEQKTYNKWLFEMSKKYNKPLIAGTDTHSINNYKAECRSILQKAKGIDFANEDEFDLTYKSYDELVSMFKEQDSLLENVYLEAINNTNIMADSCEEIVLDLSFKYPKVYDDDNKEIRNRLNQMLVDKIKRKIIPLEQKEKMIENIKEELRVFDKINMCGFMLFMSDLIMWCHDNNIPTGPARGSVGGSCIAYVLDIIDVNPVTWNTVFSRFANESRKEIGDVDVDFAPNDRDKVYDYMINKFGEKYTSFILAIGTVSDKGTIDEIGRAMSRKEPNNEIFSLENIKKIKSEYEKDPEITKEKYPEIFYYFDGIIHTSISQSMHPCGMVVSPITLRDNYGTMYKDDKEILQIDMEDVHEISLVKYDILGLKNVEIIKNACESANIPYPKAHEIDWLDKKVWDDMLRAPQGIFQFEGTFAYNNLLEFKPQNLFDMSLVTAALRPSGASYRNELMKKEFHHNISEVIDDMLKDNYGFLVYQEDIIKFLQEICGLNGSEADNVRRAIARKQIDRLEQSLPRIQEGYIQKSGKQKEDALNELQEYIQILIDSSSYMFGFNHSLAYCMIGYICAYLRYYHTPHFITAYLNNAANEDDIVGGFELAKTYGIQILPPRFRYSMSSYLYDKKTNNIYKGVGSVKFLSMGASKYLYSLKDNKYEDFISLLIDIEKDAQINSRQIEILIKLQYFEEFGKNKKLLEVYRTFKELSKRKILAKDKIEELNISLEDIKDCYQKETDKQFVGIDNEEIIKRLAKKIPEENIPIEEQIDFEMEMVGYISATYNVSKKICYVKDVNTTYSPRISLYSLSSGKEIQCKINKSMFKENPIKKGDIIECISFNQKYKQKKTDTGWEKTNELEWWLNVYGIVENIDL